MWSFNSSALISDINPDEFTSFNPDGDDVEYFEPSDEELEEYFLAMDDVCRNKADVLKYIDDFTSSLQTEQKNSTKSSVYYHNYISMVEIFKEKVLEFKFFDNLEYGWYYMVSIDTSGARLGLCTITATYDPDGNYVNISWDNSMLMIEVLPRYMSVEDFAKKYDVEDVTVRQWIRRGKLLDVRKVGSTWEISNLATLMKKYSYRSYEWDASIKLSDVPPKYEFISKYDYVGIEQCEDDAKKFKLSFCLMGAPIPDKSQLSQEEYDVMMQNGYEGDELDEDGEMPSYDMILTTKEKENFEMFLLSHPQINLGGRSL